MNKLFSIFSIFVFSLLFFANRLSAQNFKEVKETFDLNSSGKVVVKTFKGSINVTTWDQNQVEVYAKIEADDSGWSSTSPEEQLEDARVSFSSSENRLYIESEYRDRRGWNNSNTRAFVHYKIKTPKNTRLEIDDFKSQISISGITSGLELETYKGDAKVTGLKGALDLETYKGDVEIDFAEFSKYCTAETYKGKITLNLPANSKFNIDADLGKRGDLTSDFDIDTQSRSNRKKDRDEVKGSVNGGGPEIEFETYKGDLIINKK
ncbi:MAG: DUF4097 family beta strand repeat-containing protein [Ignavibacteria bacterium]|jgi:DUF4097 and DUF4098 domain-containing protein YvlB